MSTHRTQGSSGKSKNCILSFPSTSREETLHRRTRKLQKVIRESSPARAATSQSEALMFAESRIYCCCSPVSDDDPHHEANYSPGRPHRPLAWHVAAVSLIVAQPQTLSTSSAAAEVASCWLLLCSRHVGRAYPTRQESSWPLDGPSNDDSKLHISVSFVLVFLLPFVLVSSLDICSRPCHPGEEDHQLQQLLQLGPRTVLEFSCCRSPLRPSRHD